MTSARPGAGGSTARRPLRIALATGFAGVAWLLAAGVLASALLRDPVALRVADALAGGALAVAAAVAVYVTGRRESRRADAAEIASRESERRLEGALAAAAVPAPAAPSASGVERELARTSRRYSMLSQVTHASVGATGEEGLYAEACRAIVEYGQYRMAWIGALDPADGTVAPVAFAGDEQGYLDGIRISAEEGDESEGPVGTAVRLGRTVVSNDVAHDPYMRPWADAALRRGYRSVAAFPLVLGGTTAGVLAVYAGEPGFFDAHETGLFEDLASAVAFGVAHVRLLGGTAREPDRRHEQE